MAQNTATSRIDSIPASRRHGRRIMAAAAHRLDTRAVSISGSRQAVSRLARLALGVAVMAIALLSVPTLADHGSAQVAQPLLLESAAASQSLTTPATAPATVQDAAPQAPAAFSDALAAAPAGAQCSVTAHACSVPVSDSTPAASSTERTVAYGFSQDLHSRPQSGRM